MNTQLEFSPNHDEAARQNFVSALKLYANMKLHKQVEEIYAEKIQPTFEKAHGRAPETRAEVSGDIAKLDSYKFWGLTTYHSQDLLFGYVGETVKRTAREQEDAAQALMASPAKKGSLALTSDIETSKPISQIAIHRQPGGYIYQDSDTDLTTPRLYAGTIELYRNAKGMGDGSSAGSDAIGMFTADQVKERFPNLKPKRILDLGCGTGEQTTAFKKAFPDAEVHGLDTAAPLVRYAHAWAEQLGLEIHFHQANAQDTSFPDGHFDLIVSHILFHETSHKILPQVFSEAKRLLAPGGVFLNLDVPYQPEVTPVIKQVTNHWQTRHNGEPFFTGFAETNVPDALSNAGFEQGKIFADYAKFGTGPYYVFGGEA